MREKWVSRKEPTHLPSFHGASAFLEELRKRHPELPVVIVTACTDSELIQGRRGTRP